MRTRGLILAAGFAVIAGLPAAASAQWVRLQRCNGAIPCSIPFAVRYAPDPLIAAQFGWMSPNSFSGRIDFYPKLTVELDTPHVSLESGDFAEAASRWFVLAKPAPPKKVEPPPKPAATPAPSPD
ncbi:MAG TPA: hypothetical protein VLG15_01875 [Thermoanaerobaculia bacterium]|nr:hypothetical protein [Thermoanaerobaculia bacterium]